MRAPSAFRMKSGVPPTARKARTGELTPPGINFCARANSSSDWVMVVRAPEASAPARVVLGVVGQDHVGSGPADRRADLLHDALLVDPAPGRPRLHHRAPAGPVVAAHGASDPPLNPPPTL